MRRWIIGILAALLIVGIAVVFGAYRYVTMNINKEGTGAAAAYEVYVKEILATYCAGYYERFPPSGEMNSDAQFAKACECFSDDMFEKFRDLPSDQVNGFVDRPETQKKMQVIMAKCGNQHGLY